MLRWSRDSAVGIATGYGLGEPSSMSGNARFFSSPQRPDPLGAHPPSYLMDTGRSSPEVKQEGREADNSPSSRAQFKKGGAIPPLPHMSS
jgi:hypothetical protein